LPGLSVAAKVVIPVTIINKPTTNSTRPIRYPPSPVYDFRPSPSFRTLYSPPGNGGLIWINSQGGRHHQLAYSQRHGD
jgi:hypothetical protein